LSALEQANGRTPHCAPTDRCAQVNRVADPAAYRQQVLRASVVNFFE